MKKRSTSLLIMTIIFVIAAITTGIVAFQFYANGFKEVEETPKYSQYYVMISENRKSNFMQSVYRGAYERGLEENIYVDLLGTNLAQEYSREDLMRIAISSGVDGIIVEADESEEMTDLINQAAGEHIPVVTLYGDNTHSDRCSFVGVGSYNLGREYGRQIFRIAYEKGLSNMKIAVLVNAYTKDPGQNIVCSGIQDAIDRAQSTGKGMEMTLVSVDDTNAFSVEESIRDIFMEDEIPDTIVCLNELTTTCVYQAVVDYNRVGQVNILGYYASDAIMNAISRDVVYATATIDTEQMGALCIDALTEYYDLGYTNQYSSTDIEFIDKENVQRFFVYLGGDRNGENE